jgi:hypothetical protein
VTRPHDPIRNYSLLTFAALMIGDHFSMIGQSNRPQHRDRKQPPQQNVSYLTSGSDDIDLK